MPSYSFRCLKCQQELEVQHHMNEPHPTTCKCGGELQRVFHPLGIIYHISGFYHTDRALYPTEDNPEDDHMLS